jgi:hypothetical protein
VKTTELPAEIQRVLAPLAPTLVAAQLLRTGWECSNFDGDFVVVFYDGRQDITLTRDRGQFIVGGPDRSSLEEAGLWRAFDTAQELLPHLTKWLSRSDGI